MGVLTKISGSKCIMHWWTTFVYAGYWKRISVDVFLLDSNSYWSDIIVNIWLKKLGNLFYKWKA